MCDFVMVISSLYPPVLSMPREPSDTLRLRWLDPLEQSQPRMVMLLLKPTMQLVVSPPYRMPIKPAPVADH